MTTGRLSTRRGDPLAITQGCAHLVNHSAHSWTHLRSHAGCNHENPVYLFYAGFVTITFARHLSAVREIASNIWSTRTHAWGGSSGEVHECVERLKWDLCQIFQLGVRKHLNAPPLGFRNPQWIFMNQPWFRQQKQDIPSQHSWRMHTG